ncbi:MAG: SRPBCC domain-containing protein [Bacteroidetes bacterium]|nr:SRPBCC domain-containing protein [Bacteroidota bacterium]
MADIIHSISIKASPEAIFDAITTQKGLSSWWTEHVKAEPTEGSTTTFGFNDGEFEFHIQVDELTPGACVRWTCSSDFPDWNGTTLRFDIAVRDDGVAMVGFRHMGWESGSEHLARCNTDWGRLMYYLKDYLETGSDTPMMR